MKRYVIRSIKYFVALCVLFAALSWLMELTGAGLTTWRDRLAILLHTPRGWMMIAASLLLAAAYPRFGFTVRRVEGDVEEHRTQIISAMAAAGYSLQSGQQGQLYFRADGLRRALMMFEDELAVRQYDRWIEIEGLRRPAVRVAVRLEGYISNCNRRRDLH